MYTDFKGLKQFRFGNTKIWYYQTDTGRYLTLNDSVTNRAIVFKVINNIIDWKWGTSNYVKHVLKIKGLKEYMDKMIKLLVFM